MTTNVWDDLANPAELADPADGKSQPSGNSVGGGTETDPPGDAQPYEGRPYGGGADGEPEPLPDDPAPGEPYTQLGHARRLVAAFGDQLRHVVAWRRWLIWDGTRWAADITGQAHRWAKQVARGGLLWASWIDDDDVRKKTESVAKALESSRGVAGILTLAATEQTVALDPAVLDADPYLLNVANGVLDLRTREVLPHDPAAHLTKVANAAFRLDAQAPIWEGFVAQILPDAEVRAFVQRYLGYALLGEVKEHVLAVFHGAGANGKSTLIGAVDYVLGDYALTPDAELLAERSGDFHPTSAASLLGARLAIIQEFDQGRRLAEGTVKRLTGGDPIAARRMREDFWEFTPSHTFVLATNHRPQVRGTDEGIWRRIRLVPFDVVIPERDRDPDLPDRLKAEADGILLWLVAGYTDWHTNGLAEPQAVKDATGQYRHDSDHLARFLADKCTAAGMVSVNSTMIYNAWSKWCLGEGIEPGTQTEFSNALAQRGFDKKRSSRGMVFTGLGLLAEEANQRW